MIIHTHFETTSAFPSVDVLRLIELWKTSWARQGFIPVVTNRSFIERNESIELVRHFRNKIQDFPSVNGKGFDESAFNRWIAAYIICAKTDNNITTAECDVINYSYKTDCLEKHNSNYLYIGDQDGCPAFAYGNKKAFKSLIEMISNHKLSKEDNFQGRPHLSDQDFIERYYTKNKFYKSIKEEIASVFSTHNWKDFPLVHYGNPFMIQAGIDVQAVPKVDTISEVRPIVGWNNEIGNVTKEIYIQHIDHENRFKNIENRFKRMNSSKWVKLGKVLKVVG